MAATREGVDDIRNEIAKKRIENVMQEIKDGGGDPSLLDGSPVPEGDPLKPADIPADEWAGMSDEAKAIALKSKEEPSEEVEKEAPAEVVAEEPKAESRKLKGKVDGKEVEWDEDAVIQAGIKTLQKETAADRRLEEATKAREEAERLRKSVEETVAKLPKAEAPKQKEEMVVAKDELRGIVKKIQYGSEDEAADALLEYGQRMAKLGQQPSLTQAELNNILDLREAQKFVKTQYADVIGDENLKELFVVKVNRKIAAGDVRPYQEICQETGDELRQWKGTPAPQPTPDKGGKREEIRAKKASVVVIPAASARQPAPTQQKEPSPSELVERMRKQRFQA